MEIHNECFASTQKGGKRKTVSSRRAYVNTPSFIIKKLDEIKKPLEQGVQENALRIGGYVQPKYVKLALIKLNALQVKLS